MTEITNILYWISTGLLVPVTIFLLFFFVRSLILIGGLYRVYLQRAKVNKELNVQIETHSVQDLLGDLPKENVKQGEIVGFLHRMRKATTSEPKLNKILGDFEIYSDEQTGQSKLLVKIGPMLGLMGTLIPMGPALVGLATGDISSMASNMQVAFATTVVGIIIGAVGFISLQLTQRWMADDMNILQYVVDVLIEEKEIRANTRA